MTDYNDLPRDKEPDDIKQFGSRDFSRLSGLVAAFL